MSYVSDKAQANSKESALQGVHCQRTLTHFIAGSHSGTPTSMVGDKMNSIQTRCCCRLGTAEPDLQLHNLKPGCFLQHCSAGIYTDAKIAKRCTTWFNITPALSKCTQEMSHRPQCSPGKESTASEVYQLKPGSECVPGTFLVCWPIFFPAEGATQIKCTSIMLADRAVPPRAGAVAPLMGPYCSCRASNRGWAALSAASASLLPLTSSSSPCTYRRHQSAAL